MSINVKWRLRPDGKGGYEGELVLPFDPGALPGGGAVSVKARGADKALALGKAAVLAKQFTENPVLAAIMPPQAALAVKAVSALSKSAAAGRLAETAGKFAGPAMKRLGKVLGF